MCPLNIHVHDVIVLIFRIVFFFIGSIERVEEAAATKCVCHRSWFVVVRFFSPGVSVSRVNVVL